MLPLHSTLRVGCRQSLALLAVLGASLGLGSTRCNGQELRAANQFVVARIEGGSGLITIEDAQRTGYQLTYHNKSFLTVNVDNLVCSNSDQGPLGVTNWLSNGSSTTARDTVITQWVYGKTVITQAVYPVEYADHGVIVASIRVTNQGSTPSNARAELLWDLRLDGEDGPLLALDSDINKRWQQLPLHSEPSLSEYVGLSSSSWDFGARAILGVLRNNSLGLIPPDTMIAGDWSVLVTRTFPAFSVLPSSDYSDGSVLLRWGPRSIAPGATVEVARTALGSIRPHVCDGAIPTATFYQSFQLRENSRDSISRVRTIAKAGPGPVPDYTPVSASLHVSRGLRIDSPASQDSGDSVQTQTMYPSLTSQNNYTQCMWWIRPRNVTVASNESLAITVRQSGSRTDCSSTVSVENLSLDTSAPILLSESPLHITGDSSCNVLCHELVVCDTGVTRSKLAAIHVVSETNMTASNLATNSDTASVSVCVIDSLADAHGEYEIVDRAGQAMTVSYNYCTIPDTVAPVLRLLHARGDNLVSIIGDDKQPWDRGLGMISFTDIVNITGLQGWSFQGEPHIAHTATIVDPSRPASFCGRLVDLAGNSSPVVCFNSEASSVGESQNSGIDWSVTPNPARGRLLFSAPDAARTYQFDLFDLLGARVLTERITDGSHIDVHSLPSGEYIARVSTDNGVSSHRVVISH